MMCARFTADSLSSQAKQRDHAGRQDQQQQKCQRERGRRTHAVNLPIERTYRARNVTGLVTPGTSAVPPSSSGANVI